MDISQEDYEKAKNQFEEDLKNVDEDDVIYAAKKGQSKINSFTVIPKPLQELWEDIKTMVSLLGDYISKKYNKVAWKIIAAIAGAIVYFVSPIDIVPDLIPVVGYLDDAAVIALALKMVREDLDTYRAWKEAQA